MEQARFDQRVKVVFVDPHGIDVLGPFGDPLAVGRKANGAGASPQHVRLVEALNRGRAGFLAVGQGPVEPADLPAQRAELGLHSRQQIVAEKAAR